MTENEAQEEFDKKNEEYNALQTSIFDCIDRTSDAELKISQLTSEKEKLKNLRPKYLADKKDITELNTKLKNIDEDLEIQKDLITGLAEKIKPLKNNIVYCGKNTNVCFQDLVQTKMDEVAKKFNKLAKPLAEITKDYIVLEYLKNSTRISWVSIAREFGYIPNIGGDKPFLDANIHQLSIDYDKETRKKYGLPDYEFYRQSSLF